MWQVSCTYKRDTTDTKCPLCQKSEDTTEHVLECEKAKKFTLGKENSKRKWEEITEIYTKNKMKRELSVIKVQDQHKIIKESEKKSKIKIKEKEKSRKISRKADKKLKGKKYRREEQEDKNDNNNNNNNNNKTPKKQTHANAQKGKEKSKGNIIEDRQRMKVEES